MIILSHTTQLISQYSKYAISWEMQEIYFEHQQGHETFLLSTASRQVWWPTHCALGVLFPGVRQQWSKANHPLHIVPRLRIHGITHPLPHKLLWHANRKLYFTTHMTDTVILPLVSQYILSLLIFVSNNRQQYFTSSSSSCSSRVRCVSCSLILKMKLVPPSLTWSSYVPSSFWFIL